MEKLDFNLARDPFVPVKIGGERRWLTLSEVATLEDPALVDHPVAALNTPLMMLVVALVQYQQDHQGGIDVADIRNVIRGSSSAPFLWAKGGAKESGLGLFGSDAFMQIPQSWVDSSKGAISSVTSLFRPLRSDAGKALRLADHHISSICPACAATGLFFKNQFTTPMAQYWGRSAVAGLLVVMHMAVNGRGYHLPASIAMNLMAKWPSEKLSQGKAEQFPWVGEETALIKAISAPPDRKVSRSASLIPLVRAQRLCEPHTYGTCDCCGRADMPLVTGYYEIGEKSLFAGLDNGVKSEISRAVALSGSSVDDDTGEKGPYSGVKIFARMYEDAATRRHPNVPYRDNKDGVRVPVIHSETYEDATQSLPSWVRLQDVFGRDSMPLKANLFGSGGGRIDSVLNRRIAHLFYTIVPESGTNPNPKYIADESYSLLFTEDTLSQVEDVSLMAKEIVQGTRELIDILVRSTSTLFKDVEIGDKTIGLKVDAKKGMNPLGNTKRLPSIRSAVASLWDEAFLLLNEAAAEVKMLGEDSEEDGVAIAKRKLLQLEDSVRDAWKKIEAVEFGSTFGARDLYLQARASKEFYTAMKKRQAGAETESTKQEA